MTYLEKKFLILQAWKGLYWAYLDVDIPEWTMAQFAHQN